MKPTKTFFSRSTESSTCLKEDLENSRMYVAEFLKVCINSFMLIIPHQVGAVLVPEYCKWSDVVLHSFFSSTTHQGWVWSMIKSIISDTGWLKLSAYWWRHKEKLRGWQSTRSCFLPLRAANFRHIYFLEGWALSKKRWWKQTTLTLNIVSWFIN